MHQKAMNSTTRYRFKRRSAKPIVDAGCRRAGASQLIRGRTANTTLSSNVGRRGTLGATWWGWCGGGRRRHGLLRGKLAAGGRLDRLARRGFAAGVLCFRGQHLHFVANDKLRRLGNFSPAGVRNIVQRRHESRNDCLGTTRGPGPGSFRSGHSQILTFTDDVRRLHR